MACSQSGPQVDGKALGSPRSRLSWVHRAGRWGSPPTAAPRRHPPGARECSAVLLSSCTAGFGLEDREVDFKWVKRQEALEALAAPRCPRSGLLRPRVARAPGSLEQNGASENRLPADT